MRHCPPCPAPTRIYLHRGAVLPARSDLIASPLLKPKHICLVIIKSWGGDPARRRRRAAIASASVSADGAIEAASAWARLGYPRREGDEPRTPSIPADLPAPLCSACPWVSGVGGQGLGTPAWEVALQCPKQEELGWCFQAKF